MRLTDEANAESGIEIVASPPGKRLQNVLLLSGGEKALTALALLMGIFRSPFCILDEVDAPLDEPNIQRLNRLLMEMSSQTQFIVITHAKRTMEVHPGALRRDHAGARRSGWSRYTLAAGPRCRHRRRPSRSKPRLPA